MEGLNLTHVPEGERWNDNYEEPKKEGSIEQPLSKKEEEQDTMKGSEFLTSMLKVNKEREKEKQ